MFEPRKWTYHDVVVIMHRREINHKAIQLSQHKSGSRPYLSAYKRAFATVEKKFSETQRQRYRAMAKYWTEKKLPPMLQQRYVHLTLAGFN